ncbi:unnamed protein product, partial [Rotaria socialis]
ITTENFRFYIKVPTALSIPARAVYDKLNSIYVDEAPDLSTAERWSKLFRDGRKEIEDKARPDRPITGTTTENIEYVRLLIDDDPYITIEGIQARTDMSYGTVQLIICDDLKLQKITARYIPKDLSDVQRAERVRICKQNLSKFYQGTWRLCDLINDDESWLYHKQIDHKISNKAWMSIGDPPPTIVRGTRFAPKTLFSIFFKSTGPMLIHRIEHVQAVRHHYYISQRLRRLIDEIKRQRSSHGTRGIKIHHDNGLAIISHSPNFPNFSPCDFWLFDVMKDNLTNQENSESLHNALTDFMNSSNRNEYKKTFEKSIDRMQLCVDKHADYFEHLVK